ncbi:hypothetical protein ACKKBF_B19245 [Auxenochlorella protothecoides x Auxenochlorella symbiontica]
MASLGYEKIEGQDHGHWLLIIARPREESYFFAPTLKALQKQGDTVSVLCLSALSDESLKKSRQQELRDACRVLGIDADRVRCIDDPSLQEDAEWATEVVAGHIHEAVNYFRPTGVLTFDKNSGKYTHMHAACYNGLVHYMNFKKEKERVLKVKILETIPKWALYDVYYIWTMMATAWCKKSIQHYHTCWARQARRAASKHVSQKKWYSCLASGSRVYMFANNVRDDTAQFATGSTG